MKHINDHSWHASYAETDMLWLDDSINWDNSFDLVTSEYNVFSPFTAAFFLNAHHFLDWFVKLSHLDTVLLWETGSLGLAGLLLYSTWDFTLSFTVVAFSLPALFHAEFQDWASTSTYYSPELSFAMRDLVLAQWSDSSLSVTPASAFDTYQDSTGTASAEFSDYLTSFTAFIGYVVLLIASARIIALANASDVYPSRAVFYLYSIATEVRFQFDAGLQAFFFFFLYSSMMMTTFDDDQEELLEFFNSTCYYFFLFTFAYYLYKYSAHYLSFLEASKDDSKSSTPFVQALFDGLNVFALVLRFLVLMIRLNIYDGIDDALDSYYIFMADFEEEEYFPDALFSLFSTLSFDTDVNDDRSFLLEDEMDFSADLFTVYFIVWGKFAYFWIFILEEIARVALAFYVTYLLMFEINAVNRSYLEDTYLNTKRSEAEGL